MSFPFDASRGPIYVRGQVSGPTGRANLNLLLDTGTTTTLLDPKILAAIGYDPDASTDRIQVAMGNGVEIVPRVMLTRMTAVGQHRFGLMVLTHSLPPDAGVDGLLGLDFLRGLVVTLDFPAGMITVAGPAGATP